MKNNYLYQGAFALLDEDIQWTDFPLRNYDAQIGRWVQQDPYQQFASPYVGMGDDPANNTDPSGGIVPGGIGGLSTTAEKAITLGEVVVTASKASSIVVKSSNTLMKVASLSANVFKVTNIINGAVSTFPVGKGPDNLKDIIVTNKSGKELFRLDDGKKEVRTKTIQELYLMGVQWFEPEAKNYMKIISSDPNIGNMGGIKHFSWDDIINYADNHQNLLGYAVNGWWNDWKSNKHGADGYLLCTIDGKPYWSDAIGQIPFAVNAMRFSEGLGSDYSISNEQAINSVISLGQIFGSGLFGKRDKSNSYDNLMILRGALFGAQRFAILRTTVDDYIEHGMKSKFVRIKIKIKSIANNILGKPIDNKTATQYGY